MLLFGFFSNAQVLISIILGDKLNTGKVEFGLAGGVNWSTIKGLEGAESRRLFNLGFYFDIKLKNPSLLLNTGVIVKSSMGAEGLPVYSLQDAPLDSAFATGSISKKINYFNVPVLLKYKLRNNLYVKSGVMLGLRHKAFDEFTNSFKDENDLQYKASIKDQFHPLDAGLAIGAGYRLMKGNGINFDIQYYYGLVDITIDDAKAGQYNRTLYLTAGIPIGKNPKKKKS